MLSPLIMQVSICHRKLPILLRLGVSAITQQTSTKPKRINGMTERAAKTAKELLRLDDPELGLLNYRATLHSATGVFPAVALMGRQVQT